MHTFRTIDRQIGMVPASMVNQLSAIDVGRGREEAFRRQHPDALKTLVAVSRIQSTEASNAIENVTAPRKRIAALVADKTTPANRSEEEIAGYRAVLDLIHASASNIPFRPQSSSSCTATSISSPASRPGAGRRSRTRSRRVSSDGTTTCASRPSRRWRRRRRWTSSTSASAERATPQHHPVLLVGCYVFDFLAIHPFRDGNGRMGRLLTLLALYQAGYEVGRYISLERLINDTRETYYDALEAAGHGWHNGEHDIKPWLGYFLGILARRLRASSRAASAYSPAAAARRCRRSSSSYGRASPTSSRSRTSAKPCPARATAI